MHICKYINIIIYNIFNVFNNIKILNRKHYIRSKRIIQMFSVQDAIKEFTT